MPRKPTSRTDAREQSDLQCERVCMKTPILWTATSGTFLSGNKPNLCALTMMKRLADVWPRRKYRWIYVHHGLRAIETEMTSRMGCTFSLGSSLSFQEAVQRYEKANDEETRSLKLQ